MRILILPGTYDCKNLGDLAMLQVAVARLGSIWPGCQRRVLTYAPDTLRRFCPSVEPVSLQGRDGWLKARILPRWLPAAAEAAWRRRSPQAFRRWWQRKAALSPRRSLPVVSFLNELDSADALVMAGCGLLTDAFKVPALRVCDTFELALARGLPTALLSQGLGPLEDEELRGRVRDVLRKVDRIFIREERSTRRLLDTFDIPSDRICLTGDDAVEPAWQARQTECGNALGVSLRLAKYASLDEGIARLLRELLARKAKALNAPLLGIPIARGNQECDLKTLERMLEGIGVSANAGAEADTPEKAMAQTARCRLVVTGSYHAAVFALAQGIPAVCLATSPYYADKLLGLAELFPTGCRVVRLDEPDCAAQLESAIDRFWREAAQLRPGLLREAEKQVQWAHAAYDRLPAVFQARRGPTNATPSSQPSK